MKGKGIVLKRFVFSCLLIGILSVISVLMLESKAEANWWDKFGKPQYGGKASIAVNQLGDTFDPGQYHTSIWNHYEQMFMYDLTLDRDIWNFKVEGIPPSINGLLAKSWEWTDPKTLVVHLRQGVHWHNNSLTKGREFTADDVVYHFDRALGTGEFDKPNPRFSELNGAVERVTAKDKYTVIVKFKDPRPVVNWWTICYPDCQVIIEPREMVESGKFSDFHYTSGTGAYMVSDHVSGASLTLTRNPDYYLSDERYPDNKLPYLDGIKYIVIPDPATRMAAIRSGKVDLIDEVTWQNAKSLQENDPDITVSTRPMMGQTIDMRVDHKPFTDIRVRKALQLAVDIKTIAETYFGGYVSSDPPGFLAADYKGWTRPYKDWPKDLQDEYTYDPEKAKKLLAEAGYPNGFDTNCYAQSIDDLQLLEIVKAQFADIGVNMDIRVMERSQYFPFTLAGKHDQMMFNFFCNEVWPIHICYITRKSDTRVNQVHAPPEEAAPYDELYEEFRLAPDEDTAKKLACQMEEYLYRQHWAVLTPGRISISALSSHIKGYAGESIGTFTGPWYWARFWMGESTK